MSRLHTVVFLALSVLICMMIVGCAGKTPANGPGALNIAQFTLAQGAINVPYRQLLIASGGLQPYTWSISSGALPAGLSVTTDGIISGNPSGDPTQYSPTGCSLTNNSFPITCNFAAQVVDSQTPVHAVDTMGLSITINQDLSLTPVTLGTATVGEAYSANIQASNGVPPYNYSVAFGTSCTVNMQQTLCPAPGLTVNTVQSMNGGANAGNITGIPTTAGIYSFTIQATDSASETATANYTLTVVGRLQGGYAIYFNGFDTSQPANGQAFFLVGQLTAANDMNGSGTITGIIDQNGPGANIGTDVAVNGTYNIPPGSNFGTISFTRSDNNASYTFDIALSGNTNDSKLIQAAPATQWGSGLLKQQNTTALGGGVTYSFGSFGTDSSGNRFAGAGAFAVAPSLSVTGGAEDTNDDGTLSGEQFITGGSLTTPDPSTGRGTLTLTIGSNSNTYAYYVASSTELIAVETDAGGPMTLVDLLQQQGAGITGGLSLCMTTSSNCQGALNLSGTVATGGSSVPEAEVGVTTFSSCTGSPCVGNFMRSDSLPPYYVDQSVGGTYNPVSYTGGTYSIDATCGPNNPNPCGRVTLNLQGPANQPVWYLSANSQAFIVGGDADVLQGSLQPQSPPTGGFSLPALLGSYLGGTITPTLSSITNELDVAGTPPPGGIWDQNYETSGPGGPQTGLNLMGTYNLDPTYGAAFGRFAICAPNTANYCTSFTFDPNNPPVEIIYVAGGGTVGATGGKAGLVGINLGVPNPTSGTATIDPNPRISTYAR
jgi:Putative Ig domain